MYYVKLAMELEEAKRSMVKAKNISKATELEKGEHFVLGYLSRNNESLNPKEISRALGVSSARMAVILNHLETKGLAQRENDPKDSRQTIVRLLTKGIVQQKQNEKEYQDRVIRLLEALGPKDAQDYVRIQKKIAKIFGDKTL